MTCLASLAAAVLVQGCTTKGVVPGVAGDDVLDGQAKTCTQTNPDLSAGNANGTIAMTNDGFCGVFVTQPGGGPFAYGTIAKRAQHGRVYVQAVNGRTRVEYTANDGFVGADSFGVTLHPRGSGADAMVQVAVTVTQGERAAPPPAATPARPANRPANRAASTPARRSGTRAPTAR